MYHIVANAVNEIGTSGGWVGWATFLTSGGVLIWLLFRHLPAKDEQIKNFIATKDAHVERISSEFSTKLASTTAHFREEMKETRKEFKETLNDILSHCDKELSKIVELHRHSGGGNRE